MTKRSADTAAAQLKRLLQVIPRLADGQDHPVSQLSRIAGVSDAKQLIADLRSLVERFDMPGAFVEGVQVWIDTDNVSVISSHFRRPMRLTIAELSALELGLAVLRAEREPADQGVVERALTRLRSIITQLRENGAHDGIRSAHIDPSGKTAELAAVRAALASHSKLRIRYHSGSSSAPTSRTIRPYGLLFASGAWYVPAFCETGIGLRFFRLDRVDATEPTNEVHEIPRDISADLLQRQHRVLSGSPLGSMTVKYSARIAPWIAEREGIATESDGSLVIQHPVHDTEWALRHVLQYGPDAIIVEPRELRDAMRERLKAMA